MDIREILLLKYKKGNDTAHKESFIFVALCANFVSYGNFMNKKVNSTLALILSLLMLLPSASAAAALIPESASPAQTQALTSHADQTETEPGSYPLTY